MITGGVSPIEIKEYLDKTGRVYQGDKVGNKLPSSTNYLEKIGNKAKAIATNAADWINETNPNHVSYKQKTNILGSALVAPYAPELAVTKAIVPKLASHAGRKIAQSVTKGLSSGALGGAVEGSIQSVQEKKNPVKTILGDAATGAVIGAGFGAFGANIQKAVRGQKLKNIEDLKTLRKAETSYYKDYNQGRSINYPKLGQINMTQAGLETVSKQPQAGRNFSTLINDIKHSNYKGYEKPIHKKHGTKDNIKGFHKLSNANQEFLIADADDGLKYYLSKNVDELAGRPSRVDSSSSNTIIPEISQNLKAWGEWLAELRNKQGYK